MTVDEVMIFLESKGSEQTRNIYAKHGAPKNSFGVKVADMKIILKKEKVNHALAMDLYKTGNGDAQYLAGLLADAKAFSKADFLEWAKNASWHMISEYSLAWNIAESPLCMELCSEWIDSKDPQLQGVGWASMGSYMIVTPNDAIDFDYHKSLIPRIEKEIHAAENRVKYSMNQYLISLGATCIELMKLCKAAGKRIGKVEVFMGETACKVPVIDSYLENMENRNRIGNKKKTAKC